MTPSELKRIVSVENPHFFTRKTMNFFGDTMKNYGCRSAIVEINDSTPGPFPGVEIKIKVEVWELYRKRAVKHGLKNSAYFRKDTLQWVHI